MKLILTLKWVLSLLLATPALAGGHINWNVVEAESRIAFGSVKKNTVGEVHHFNKLSGLVKENGETALTIDLGSVVTNIDIRDVRMKRHVFQEGKATAVIQTKIDMNELNGMKPGEMKFVEVEVKLAFAGANASIDAEMMVVRLSEDRVLVTTADFIMVSAEDLGINAGIDMLKKLAKLPGITRVVPVSVRMVLQK